MAKIVTYIIMIYNIDDCTVYEFAFVLGKAHMEMIVRQSFFIYSPCHYLEGINDALYECSGLVRMVGPCAQTRNVSP